MLNFGKVAVLMGGFSSEREVSLESGRAVLAALRGAGVDAHALDPEETPLAELKAQGFDCAFNILHGAFGEDGTVQGALEALGIPYTGCGVLASAIGMDKYRCKLLWKGLGLPVPDYAVLREDSDFAAVEHRLGLPLFVKPSNEGSSVGVAKIKEPGRLQETYRNLKKQFKGEIIAEAFIGGGEYTCAILDGRALPCIKIIPATEFYDKEAKYDRNDTVYQCPADLGAEDEQTMRRLAEEAFQAIGGRGWGRIDFLKGRDGGFYLLEANTLPGMTSHSLFPMAAAREGMDFTRLCIEILKTAHDGK
ncbi:MAG: D-alanine--D-alanine ligase [Neisseria sp.]|nr:D-alanine--D-alanine ligase [Neisseria sp.]